MSEMGELLKAKRQDLNLSLKEIENATSIRMVHLRAIEDGELGKIISPVYAQGFVRQYAIFLGLDAERLVNDHIQDFMTGEKQEFSYGIGTLEMRGNPGGGVKWLPNVGWLLASTGVLFLAWYLANFLGVL